MRIGRISFVALTALLVLGTGVFVACGGGDDGSEEPPPSLWITNSDADTVYKVDPTDGSVEETIEVGAYPSDVAVGDDAVWVPNAEDGTVSKIDPDEGSVSATIDTEDARGVVATDDEVWISRWDPAGIVAIDPETDDLSEEITTDKNQDPDAMVEFEDKIFAEESYSGGVLSFDPATSTVDGEDFNEVVDSITADDETVFVGGFSNVYEVDPTTLAVTEHPTDSPAWAVAKDESEDALWVATDDGVRKLDLATGEFDSTIVEIDASPSDMIAADGSLWMVDDAGGLSKIDPESMSVEDTYEIGDATTEAFIAYG